MGRTSESAAGYSQTADISFVSLLSSAQRVSKTDYRQHVSAYLAGWLRIARLDRA